MEPTPHAGPILAKQRAVNGYAPGNYFCKCVNCGGDFQGDKRAHACPVCAFEQPMQELLQQLAAAEARATEGAAEAGKWQQRHGELQQELAEQERDKLALVQELATLQFNSGAFYGRVFSATVLSPAESEAYQWASDYPGYPALLAGIIQRLQELLMPAAPAPVAPQRQEGGGQ